MQDNKKSLGKSRNRSISCGGVLQWRLAGLNLRFVSLVTQNNDEISNYRSAYKTWIWFVFGSNTSEAHWRGRIEQQEKK